MSAFEQYAVQRLLDQAEKLGVPVPDDIRQEVEACRAGTAGSWPARRWAELHPNDDPPVCCYGACNTGPQGCTCWEPIYTLTQALPRPPQSAADLGVRPSLCGDCAFRPGSPERAEEYSREALYALADRREPFYCHDGMRRPLRWEHPDGRTLDGAPDDWAPPIVAGLPYRADGSPGLLCAGWAARAAHQPRDRSLT